MKIRKLLVICQIFLIMRQIKNRNVFTFLNWSPSDRGDIFTSLFCFGKLLQLHFVSKFDTERSPLSVFILHTPNVRILFSKCWTTHLAGILAQVRSIVPSMISRDCLSSVNTIQSLDINLLTSQAGGSDWQLLQLKF